MTGAFTNHILHNTQVCNNKSYLNTFRRSLLQIKNARNIVNTLAFTGVFPSQELYSGFYYIYVIADVNKINI